MKNIIHTIVMGLLTLFSAYLYLLADTPSISQKIIIKENPTVEIYKEQNKALDYLNKIRVGAGLIPLSSNNKLAKAAKNHAIYLIENNTIGHYEDKNKIGYTGEYGSQRSIYSGYKTSMVIENISNNNFTAKESIDGLMAAIYHRFGFLDFHIDEIGIGIEQGREDKSQTAFVYDMGSHNLEEICQKKNSIKSGEYASNICADKSLKIDAKLFNNTLSLNRKRNNKVILYPYDNQVDVPPAFYDELPDPLPEYSVSGFPISISFNDSYFQQINMVSFKLFDNQNREIKDTIVYNHLTDPNKRLKRFEFALFPLKRLSWGSSYHVKVVYIANGRLKRKEWKFKTRDFKRPIYQVTSNHNSFNINIGEASIFYFPPQSKRDILGSLKYPASLDISFIDKNTIKLIANSIEENSISLDIGNRRLNLNIQKKI
ncbi:MAG: CAP domain-containing protein [Epsilonproteobacteria bacterium]|nr:CAP domain-containing protein [Campylobacterota bacterium]